MLESHAKSSRKVIERHTCINWSATMGLLCLKQCIAKSLNLTSDVI